MSRASGSKRKAAAVQNEENAPPMKKIESEDNLSATIDREIEKEIALIKSGQHPNLQAHIAALEVAKQKKLDAADRHRKLQIKNINALYEYEVEDATALYNKGYAELQEDMIAEVQTERNRQRQALLETSKNKRNGVLDTATATAGGRSLRSTALASDAADSATSVAGSSANAYGREYLYNRTAGAGGNASVTNGTAGSTSGGTRRRNTANQGLDFTLPESTMRSDFVDIVRDLHLRAASLERSKAKMPEREIRLSGDLSEIYIGDEAFTAGDLVVVFSVLSQENIHGIITAITPRDLIVRTPTGARVKILTGQLRTGRVSLTRDRDTLENSGIFNRAAEMQAYTDKVYRTPY